MTGIRTPRQLPRWAIPVVWTALVLAIHFALPWGIAQLGQRHGWLQAAPTILNLAGLAAVGAGLAIYIACLVAHFKTYRAPVRIGFTPPHLVVDGPYRYSRNPMYLSGLLAWFGWAIFYGSLPVLAGLALLWAAFAFHVVPEEERQLAALFGDEYHAYKESVRRWLGRR